jgi:hypothetical protein
MIRLLCSGCQTALQVKPEVAGRRIHCPHCRQINLVPAAAAATMDFSQDQAQIPWPAAALAEELATLPPFADFSNSPAILPPVAHPVLPTAIRPTAMRSCPNWAAAAWASSTKPAKPSREPVRKGALGPPRKEQGAFASDISKAIGCLGMTLLPNARIKGRRSLAKRHQCSRMKVKLRLFVTPYQAGAPP